ncbi:MAG: helix-turn-helix domain-containing protein, partial [Betaproteobacteria bacterium]|nr:helix-turn-helix domain-containing protein [Betaproteobacteria bacterium]
MQSQSDSAEENSLEAEATPTLVPEPTLAPESGPMPASEPTLAPESGLIPASEPMLAPESGLMPASGLALESGPTVVFDPMPEPALMPEPEPTPAPGEILRQAREARGESLNDVARTLKLSAQQLEALEAGRYDTLPGPTFVRGFLRNYANYLDLPPEPLLEGISARVPTAADLASMIKLDGNVQPAASPRPRSRLLPAALIVLAALALAGLIWAGIHYRWFEFRFGATAAAPAQVKTVRLERQSKKLDPPVPVNIAPGSENPPPPVGSELADESAG